MEWVWKHFLLRNFFGIVWEESPLILLHMIEFICEIFRSWTFVCWDTFKITNSVSLPVISLLFLSDFVLGDCTLLGICPFLLDSPFYWCLFIVLAYLCISVVSVVTSFSLESTWKMLFRSWVRKIIALSLSHAGQPSRCPQCNLVVMDSDLAQGLTA